MKNTLKTVIVLLLAITILALANVQGVGAASTTNTFKDVKNTAWYNTYVNKLVDLKITTGYKDGTYKPANTVTRAEFVTFLCKTKGYIQTKGDPFTDTQKHWASGYITIALANGIIDLTTDKKFRPDDAIKRLEAVEMMCRALNIPEDTTTKNPYADVKTITSYTNAAYANYLMQGSVEKNVRYFKPSDKLTRGEVASVIVNAYDYNADKMTFLNEKIAAANEKAAAEKAEKDRTSAWLNSIDKGVSKDLLINTTGLTGGKTVQECNEYATKELEKFTGWMEDCNITDVSAFKKDFVRAGKAYTDVWYNRNYTQMDAFEKGMREVWAPINVENYLNKSLQKVKNNKIVMEGKFFTGKELIFINDQQPVLRGTVHYRYLKPTSLDILNQDICGDTGKHAEYNVWYEEDIELKFDPEGGLRVSKLNHLSESRLVR